MHHGDRSAELLALLEASGERAAYGSESLVADTLNVIRHPIAHG
ncbi:MAG: hypothetical protein O7G84_14015 [Gammaproteobacteria bacterium]|nr:hypothetical protein [Gammaproteobacteria bacterium]